MSTEYDHTGYGGLFLYREIYIDVVFAANFLMDFVLLRLVGAFLGIRAVWYRTLLGAVLGAVSSCLIVLIPADCPYPAVYVLHLLTAAAMVCGGYKIHSKNMLIKVTLTLYVLAFLCGGFWELLTRGRKLVLWMFLFFTGLTYLFFTICVKGYQNWLRKRETFCRVKLKAHGKILNLTGLYDTGNLLTDPITGKPVSIVEEQTLAELVPAAVIKKLKDMKKTEGEYDDPVWESLHPHFIVYCSVGNNGTLPVVTLEDMCIYRGEQIIYVYHPVIAISAASFHSQGRYQVILNGKIM